MIKHNVQNDNAPKGDAYQAWLAEYAAVLALCDDYVVPKYLEIPMAGCACLAQYHYEYEKMGFIDGGHYIAVTKKNLNDVCRQIKAEPQAFQAMATKGYELAMNQWSAAKFADRIYEYH